MWVVVEISKKQYLVKEGDTIKVNRLKATEGEERTFDKVLVAADEKKVKIGTPYLDKMKVTASVLGEKKGEKVIVYKCKRRKKYRKKQGARQTYTSLKILKVAASRTAAGTKK